jgi:hypothetical protein
MERPRGAWCFLSGPPLCKQFLFLCAGIWTVAEAYMHIGIDQSESASAALVYPRAKASLSSGSRSRYRFAEYQCGVELWGSCTLARIAR